jgi:hypothetical protein
MKPLALCLPTALIIALAVALAHAPGSSSLPGTQRASQLRQLDSQLSDLSARRRLVADRSTLPFLPR